MIRSIITKVSDKVLKDLKKHRQMHFGGATPLLSWARRMVISLAMVPALTGGAAAQQGPTWIARIEVTRTVEDGVFIPSALEAAGRKFVGAPRRDGSAAPASGASFPGPAAPRRPPLIRPDMLSPGSDTPYRLRQSLANSVAIRVARPLRPGLDLTGRLALGRGSTVYDLPDGLGVLRDPTTIRFRTHFALLEAGLAWRRPLRGTMVAEVEVAAGLRETRIKTHVTSALLDVRSASRHRDPYIALRGGIELSANDGQAPKIFLGAELRLFPGETATIGSRLALRF
jgi:hypothetical protein